MKQTNQIQVLYIITQLELGGAQKVCLSLFHGIANKDHQTHLISGTGETNAILAEQIYNNPNTIFLKQMTRSLTLFGFIHELRCFFALIKSIKALHKKNPHLIVHTHSTKAGILGRWAAFFAGVKKRMHTIHGYAFHEQQPYPIWLAIYLIELMTSVITTHYVCVSSADVKTGMRLFPGFANKHSIIRAAIDWEQFYVPAPLDPVHPEPVEGFIFGTIACFKPQKNIFDLLKAFAHVYHHNNNVTLEIIGDGAQRKEIEAWIKNNHLQKQILLHGWQDKVAPIMLSWHAFTLTSLWEGLPCAIIEARMLKLPVLCYDTGGIHDVIIDGCNGFLFKKGSWQELAQKMLELTRNKSLYTKLHDHMDDLRDFQTNLMIDQHLELYKTHLL